MAAKRRGAAGVAAPSKPPLTVPPVRARASSIVEVQSDTPAAIWVDPRPLQPLLRNPRPKKFAEAVALVKRLIQKFGWGPTVVVQESTGLIVSGNARQAAALELNLDKVPARVLDLTDAQARAMALADQKSTEVRRWERALLAQDLGELRDAGEDIFDLGFEQAELDRLLGENYHSTVEEIPLGDAQATFFLSATGPLPRQLEVLDKIREHFAGSEVEVTITSSEY